MEAVLKGTPITPINSETAANGQGPPLKAYDIRHVSRDENSAASNERVKTRCRVKRAVKPKASKVELNLAAEEPARQAEGKCYADETNGSTSHESSLSHQSELAIVENESAKESESMVSEETAEASAAAATLLFRTEPDYCGSKRNEPAVNWDSSSGDMGIRGPGLELTLGFQPLASRANHVVPVKKRRLELDTYESVGTCKVELGLQ